MADTKVVKVKTIDIAAKTFEGVDGMVYAESKYAAEVVGITKKLSVGDTVSIIGSANKNGKIYLHSVDIIANAGSPVFSESHAHAPVAPESKAAPAKSATVLKSVDGGGQKDERVVASVAGGGEMASRQASLSTAVGLCNATKQSDINTIQHLLHVLKVAREIDVAVREGFEKAITRVEDLDRKTSARAEELKREKPPVVAASGRYK